MKKAIILLSALLCAATTVSAKDASDGLIGWWRAESKPNGTVFAPADLKDHVHAGSTADAVNHATADGTYPAYPICHTNIDLVYPMGSGVIPNAPCFYIPQPTNYDASGTCVANRQNIVFPADKIDVANMPCTFMVRFKPERRVSEADGGGWGYTTLFAYDWSYSGNTGWKFCLRAQGSPNWSYPAIYFGKSGVNGNLSFGASDNLWLDLGVVIEPNVPESGKTRVIFYQCKGDGRSATGGSGNKTTVKTQTVDTVVGYTALAARKIAIGDTSGTDGWAAATASSTAFRGLIHEMKLYDRALTKEEFEQACAPSTDPLFSVGTKNGSTEEFSDESAVAVYEPATMPWSNMRRTLTAANPSLSIKTELSAVDREIPRILEFSPIYSDDCPHDAAIDVLLNGTKIETVARSSAADRLIYISSAHLLGLVTQSGGTYPLILTLQRSGGMGGTIGFDRISLGGGWQLGVKDDNDSEFRPWEMGAIEGIPNSTLYNFYTYYLSRQDIRLIPAPLYSVDAKQQTLRLRFSVSDALASKGEFSFTTRDLASHIAEIALNGEVLCSNTLFKTDRTIEIGRGKMRAGINEIRAKVFEGGKTKFSFDYFRLAPKRLPVGAMLIVR